MGAGLVQDRVHSPLLTEQLSSGLSKAHFSYSPPGTLEVVGRISSSLLKRLQRKATRYSRPTNSVVGAVYGIDLPQRPEFS